MGLMQPAQMQRLPTQTFEYFCFEPIRFARTEIDLTGQNYRACASSCLPFSLILLICCDFHLPLPCEPILIAAYFDR